MRIADYETLLHKILSATPSGHDDLTAIPRVLQSLKNLAFDMEPSIRTGHQQVEARRLISQIIFKPNEYVVRAWALNHWLMAMTSRLSSGPGLAARAPNTETQRCAISQATGRLPLERLERASCVLVRSLL